MMTPILKYDEDEFVDVDDLFAVKKVGNGREF